MLSLNQYPALVLNADFRPISLSPLYALKWQDAVKAVYEKTHTPVAEYDEIVRSPSMEMRLPSVLVLSRYVDRSKHFAPFTRFGCFLIYGHICSLCGRRFRTEDLTFEHIMPRSRGGHTDWDNVVPACSPCNLKKGNRTPEEAGMPLKYKPYRPTKYQVDEMAKSLVHTDPYYTVRHKTWLDALYWTIALDK